LGKPETCIPAVARQCCVMIPDLVEAVKMFGKDPDKRPVLIKALHQVLGGSLSLTLVTTLPCSELMDRLRDLDTFAEDIVKHLEKKSVEVSVTA
jgi:hypothetical protein